MNQTYIIHWPTQNPSVTIETEKPGQGFTGTWQGPYSHDEAKQKLAEAGYVAVPGTSETEFTLPDA